MTPAYVTYLKTAVPSATGDQAKDTQALRNWLNSELAVVQQAFRVRTIKTVTAAYSVTVLDDVILVDTTAGSVTVTLPDATRVQNGEWTIKKIVAANNLVVSATAGATIDGAATITTAVQWASYTVRSNGVSYFIL